MLSAVERQVCAALVAWAGLAATWAPAAQAQGAATLRHACAADYAAHCTGENPASGIERACLAQYYVNLSAACRAAMSAGSGPADPADQTAQ